MPIIPPLASQGYGEDSLVFLSRGRIRMVPDGAAFLQANPGAYAIVPASEAVKIAGATGARTVGRISGFDYADGDAYELVVLARDAREQGE